MNDFGKGGCDSEPKELAKQALEVENRNRRRGVA